MSQDEVSQLSAAIENLTKTFHGFEIEHAKTNALHEARLSRLEESDSEQWKIIRDTQRKILKFMYLIAGALAVLAFLDMPDKIRAILMR